MANIEINGMPEVPDGAYWLLEQSSGGSIYLSLNVPTYPKAVCFMDNGLDDDAIIRATEICMKQWVSDLRKKAVKEKGSIPVNYKHLNGKTV